MDIRFANFKQEAEKYIKLFDGRDKSSDRLPYIVCDNSKEVEDVNAKIAKLTRIQVSTIYDRITAFWDNQNGMGDSLDKWAKF